MNRSEKIETVWSWRGEGGRRHFVEPGDGFVITSGDMSSSAVDALEVCHVVDGWEVTAVLQPGDEGAQVAEIRWRAPDGASVPILDSTVWRRLRLGALHRQITADLRSIVLLLPAAWHRGYRAPRPGRGGHPVSYYAGLVRDYLDACAEGPRPMERLTAELRYPNSRTVVNAQLTRAERLGLIEGRSPGRAGGMMTDRCRRVLEGDA